MILSDFKDFRAVNVVFYIHTSWSLTLSMSMSWSVLSVDPYPGAAAAESPPRLPDPPRLLQSPPNRPRP